MSVPLIFIHYGDAPYLAYTLRTARRTNPEKRIVLLGDESNRKYATGLADFMPFEELAYGEDLTLFDRVFQPIQGSRHRFNKLHGTDYWLRFVFRRWFLVANFLEREKIAAFWTFDSDTLVLAPLTPREKRFSSFDCSEQCRGECLNGYVSTSVLARRYVRAINGLFQDAEYLESQRVRLETHLGLSFNEMDAYREFRRREGIRSVRASDPQDGEVFDDALAFIEDYEKAPEKMLNRTEVKRLWTGRSGGVFARHKTFGIVRLLTANLSWMPLFVYRRLSEGAVAPDQDGAIQPDLHSEISYGEPLLDGLWRKTRLKLAPLERTLSNWKNQLKPCP